MGIFDDVVGGSLKPVLGEDAISGIPGLNFLTSSESDETKALLKKQKELEEESARQKKRNAQMRMQALGQSMLAFNPQNQMMAQMFGPQAAFSPQQMSQMAADPSIAGVPWGKGTEEQNIAQVKDKQRRAMIEQQMQPLGPGPAPMKLPPSAAPRRF